MDKNTLSNYGWVVVAVLVLAVMIALATPFGSYIRAGVENTTAGLFDTSEKALNVVGMSARETEYVVIGDVNDNNTSCDSEDMMIIQMLLIGGYGIEETPRILTAADINKDGIVNTGDIARYRQWIVGGYPGVFYIGQMTPVRYNIVLQPN